MKRWKILNHITADSKRLAIDKIVQILLLNRGVTSKKAIDAFLHPPQPQQFTPKEVGIVVLQLKKVLARINTAIKNQESIVVYADYDADGITAGTIMWETLHKLGARVMPYIPHRVEEGYGLSKKGLDQVKKLHDPKLIITVDHGITAWEKVEYAKSLGVEVIVTDHHVKPPKLPDCITVHTTQLCGAGVAWFLAKELLYANRTRIDDANKTRIDDANKTRITNANEAQIVEQNDRELLALAAIGTIADMVPLTGVNRAIAKHGLTALNKTSRIGLIALIKAAGLISGKIDTYSVSHILAPRLNAMGRLEHALDALRLLCTKQTEKAEKLAQILNDTNRERQELTLNTAMQAKAVFAADFTQGKLAKLLFVADEMFNQGVIGLVAGKLVETYYRPAIVISKGETISKASARSIHGFNIIEIIRSCSDLLVDAGGHPMAAGFTVETRHLDTLKTKLEKIAAENLTEPMLQHILTIELEMPVGYVNLELWEKIQQLSPFGIGNFEPVFASRNVFVTEKRLVGADGKHIKIKLTTDNLQLTTYNAIGFNLGEKFNEVQVGQTVDIAYTIDRNAWNGNQYLQLKLKDLRIAEKPDKIKSEK